MKKAFKLGNSLVIVITFILFAVALLEKGFTKEILLEAGVLLISIKIILMNVAISNSNKEIIKKLDELNDRLNQSNSKSLEK